MNEEQQILFMQIRLIRMTSEKLGITLKQTADKEWLHCIVAHRKSDVFLDMINRMKDFDVISGKIANDNTNATILAYMSNFYG